MVMLRRSVNLTTLFLGRLRHPKRFTSAYFCQELTTVLLESVEGEMKIYSLQNPTPSINPRIPGSQVTRLPTALRSPANTPLTFRLIAIQHTKLALFQAHSLPVQFIKNVKYYTNPIKQQEAFHSGVQNQRYSKTATGETPVKA